MKALLLSALSAVAAPMALAATTEPVEVKTVPGSARVVTCAVSFPLDSVKFAEDQVLKCMAAVDVQAVSYIHVIATADTSGTSRHNLYLSTRRAGAIEAFLSNRYPRVQVHAFGGGENPMFGKLARIFVVEHPPEGPPATDIQLASVGTPEIIERTRTEYVTRTELRPAPKTGLAAGAHTGAAWLGSDPYRYVGLELRQTVRLEPVGSVAFGVRHRLLQSNEAVDAHSTSLMAGRGWELGRIFGYQAYYDQSVELGRIAANGRALEWGATAAAGLRNADVEAALVAARSNHVTSVGLGVGVRL